MSNPSDHNTGDNNAPVVSVILNVMAFPELAMYGLRSWLLQDFKRPYEVVLSVYNNETTRFEPLLKDKNPNCRVILKSFDPPEFFNISAANNVGMNLSSGEYVFFANADVIYLGDFLSRAVWEFEHHHLAYAVAARVNLLKEHVDALKPAMEYTGAHAFDFMSPYMYAHGVTTWPALSPWMSRRDVAYAIGGFDPKVLVAEDRDIDQRATHYIKRNNLQHSHISFCNLRGYHLFHPSTGLFDAFTQSKAVIEARQKIMDADPNSTADVVNNPLNDYDALVKEMRSTPKPPLLQHMHASLPDRIKRRAKDVWHTLRHGR